MIPPVLILPPALGCLFVARCAAFYWEMSAELWSVMRDMTASADIVPFPATPRRSQPSTDPQHNAEIVRFAPSER
jgi:hypothetical protein